MKTHFAKKIEAGFTLIELLVYAAIAVVTLTIVTFFAVWAIRIGAKIRAENEVINNGRRAIETIAGEIKKATAVYAPTSVFDTYPGQLSLEQKAESLAGETLTYVDIFLCGQSLCLKREGSEPLAITSGPVAVTNLTFTQLLNSASSPSIQINLTVESLSWERAENHASLTLTATTNLRAY